MIMPSDKPNPDSHESRSLLHYKEIYKTLDPHEISIRTALNYSEKSVTPCLRESFFSIKIMGTDYRATFPEFALIAPDGKTVTDGWRNILFLRYLCEGRYAEPAGKQLSYREIPWGNVYFPNFEGRCLKRFAAKCGKDIEGFKRRVESLPELNAEKLGKSDAGYRFEFLGTSRGGLFLTVFLWAGDDEFPANCQMLFSDNFAAAFTAEDLTVVGEVALKAFLG